MDWYPPIGTIFAAKFVRGMDSHCYKRREAIIRRIRHGMAESQTHHDNYQINYHFFLLGPIGIHPVIAWFQGLSWSNMKGNSQLTLHSCIPCFCSIWRCRCLPILKVRFYFQVLCYCWIFLFQWDIPMHLQQGWQKAVIECLRPCQDSDGECVLCTYLYPQSESFPGCDHNFEHGCPGLQRHSRFQNLGKTWLTEC